MDILCLKEDIAARRAYRYRRHDCWIGNNCELMYDRRDPDSSWLGERHAAVMFGNWEGVERQIHATCNFLV